MEPFDFSKNSLGFSPTPGIRTSFLIIFCLFSIIFIISICGYCQGPMLLCFQSITHTLGSKESSQTHTSPGTLQCRHSQTIPAAAGNYRLLEYLPVLWLAQGQKPQALPTKFSQNDRDFSFFPPISQCPILTLSWKKRKIEKTSNSE